MSLCSARCRQSRSTKSALYPDVMKGINTPGQALDSGGVASFSAPRDGVSYLAFPALAPERNHHADSFPLAPLGNESSVL
jgi:hypothetical protein